MSRTLKLGVLLIVLGLLSFGGAWCLQQSNSDEERFASEEAAMALYYLETAVAMPEIQDSQRVWSLPNAEDCNTSAVTIDTTEYLGMLYIPSLQLTLPIACEWSLAQARKTPCRWVGSVAESNLIIAGHNYRTHFGHLSELKAGDLVQFVDCDGREFWYEVSLLETIEGTDTRSMLEGNWDLTLFTCTYGGANRVTVRCEYATD